MEVFKVFLQGLFFLDSMYPFFYPVIVIVYGRARLAMEGKSVVPMSVPVSIYGHPRAIAV
jgi:hypothetical protein